MKRFVLAVVAGGVLTGCAGIPNTGPVVQGPRVDVVRNDGYVRVIARPPVPGMAPDALVRGFLTASASLPDGDETALQYLTDEAASAWDPQRQTVVYDAAALTLTTVQDDVVRIGAPKIGVIDAGYRYLASDAGAMVSAELKLQQVDGEWRISTPPSALFLSEGDVVRSFRSYPLFFLDPDYERMVPEFVMLPIGSGTRATQLLRLLVAGPSSQYGEAIATAIPKGASIQFGRVELEGVTAVVSLRVGDVPEAAREPLIGQIVWTLSQLGEVVLTRVSFNGEPQSIRGKSAFAISDFQSFDPNDGDAPGTLVYVSGSQLRALTDGEARVVRDDEQASAGAVTRDGALLALVTVDRKLLFIARGTSWPRPIAAGQDIAKPQFLPDGRLWFVDREAQGGLRMWDATFGVRRVIVGLPPAARILDFAIAPDHRRIALVVSDGVATSLRVGAIDYTENGARIVGLNRVERRLTSITTIAWETLNSIVVLGSAGAVGVQPIRVSLPAGGMTLLGGPANAVSIAAGAGQPIVVGDQAGQLWEFRDNRWSAGVLGTAPMYVA